jgi:hypothetical protein
MSCPIRESIAFLSPLRLGILPVVWGWLLILTITHTYHASGRCNLPSWKTQQDLGRSPDHSLRIPESCPPAARFFGITLRGRTKELELECVAICH